MVAEPFCRNNRLTKAGLDSNGGEREREREREGGGAGGSAEEVRAEKVRSRGGGHSKGVQKIR